MKLRYKIANGILLVVALGISALAIAISYTASCEPQNPVSGRQTMLAAVARCYGGPEVIEMTSIERPTPGDGEVLVKVKAAAVNPLDYHYMRGSPYLMRLVAGLGRPNDSSMGVDFSGIVESVGGGVARFQPGDEVYGSRGGAFAEYVVMPEDRALVAKPENISFAEAAAVPVAAETAIQALRDHGQLKPGDKVLINGASGGVGTFAVQIAKAYGADVTGVCSTRNVEMVTSIGADKVFDYTKENYTESGELYDLIIDNVGNHSPLANVRMLKPDGIYVLIGGPKGNWIAPLKRPLQTVVLSMFVDQKIGTMLANNSQEDLIEMNELMASGSVTPVIDRYYSLGELPEAIRYSESGRARGKIIIEVD